MAEIGLSWSSIAVDSMDDIKSTMAALRKAGLKLARKPKDRFANPTDAGYRDLMMSVVYPNGHIGELQLHLKPVLKAKDAGHHFYEQVRTISANAQKEGRTTLTDKEQKIVDEANGKMKKLYDDAWAQATSSKTKGARVAAEKKYYDYRDLPVSYERKKFPVVHKANGKVKTLYDLQKFFNEARPITEAEFKEMLASYSKKADK